MKIDLRKSADFDKFRGIKCPKKFVIVGWKHLNATDLDYFLKFILAPYRVKIELK